MAGLVGIQLLRNSDALNPEQIPGEARGDIRLQEESLPKEIAGWTRRDFTPPKSATERSDQQYWWSHSWEYSTDSASALVSFDQANWTGWHELPQCYICVGWKYQSRNVVAQIDEEGARWDFVCATFKKDNGQHCLVLVSMFYEDGSPVSPRGTTNETSLVGQASLQDRFAGRVGYAPADEESLGLRALQCQVCLQSSIELPDELKQAAQQLHLATRELIRQKWHDENSQLAADHNLDGDWAKPDNTSLPMAESKLAESQ